MIAYIYHEPYFTIRVNMLDNLMKYAGLGGVTCKAITGFFKHKYGE
jgi:hypothetical protein